MKQLVFGIAAGAAMVCILVAAPAAAQHDHHATAAASAASAPTDGTVRKIDAARGSITLTHGPIPNIGMDGMTMAFKIKERGQLTKFKVGDKVRFNADMVGGEVVITRIEAAK